MYKFRKITGIFNNRVNYVNNSGKHALIPEYISIAKHTPFFFNFLRKIALFYKNVMRVIFQ